MEWLTRVRRLRVAVFVGVFAATLAAGAPALARPGVYSAQTNVVLLVPSGTTVQSNPWDGRSNPLVDLAGVTVKRVSGDLSSSTSVSDDVSLAAQGVSQGWLVRQPNDGGQWNYSFSQPIIEVQVTGPTAGMVATEMEDILGRVEAAVRAQEDSAAVNPENRVRLVRVPGEIQIRYDGGSRKRAVLAVLSLALLLAGSAIGIFNWWSESRRAASPPSRSRAVRVLSRVRS